MEGRITPDIITKLDFGHVFVFGSNLAGRHGAGAAKTALGWGARWGHGNGLQGMTYGIPTKDASVRRTLSVEEIRPFVDEFISFAKINLNKTFLVTEIGCGLAGHSPKDIAPLFKEAIETNNIHLPAKFWQKIKTNKNEHSSNQPD